MTKPARVLIVDDSTFVRRALARMLGDDPQLEIIAEGRDGLEAVRLAKDLQPDIITLDLELPKMSGIEVLRAIRSEVSSQIIMVSSFLSEGTEKTFEALDEGAFDFIDKTQVRNRLDFWRLKEELLEKVHAAIANPYSEKQRQKRSIVPRRRAIAAAADAKAELPVDPSDIIVVGASTGGPHAMRRLLAPLNDRMSAALFVVQHMPPGFSQGFARRLDRVTSLSVSKLEKRTRVSAGHVYVVPPGFALRLRQTKAGLVAKLFEAEDKAQYRPSFSQAIAETMGVADKRCIAVALTGMGTDGSDQIRAFADSGGSVFVQDSASCVISGMPEAIVSQVKPAYIGTPEAIARHINAAVHRTPMSVNS